jgi:hypothetical protein
MKDGDILYCYKNLMVTDMHDNILYQGLTKNKYYRIMSIDLISRNFTILDDSGDRHNFSFDRYLEWFCDLRKARKIKLKNLTRK